MSLQTLILYLLLLSIDQELIISLQFYQIIPFIDINVSRPQHLVYPVEKCGKPAAIVTL